MAVIPSFEDRVMDKLRKVRLPDGQVAVVMADFGNGYCTVQIRKWGLYPLVRTEGLRDIPDTEFNREFR